MITGAAGFVGSHLTERCLRLGWQVRAVDAFTDYYDRSLKQRNVEGLVDHPRCTMIERTPGWAAR